MTAEPKGFIRGLGKSERRAADFYPTPPGAVEALLDMEGDDLRAIGGPIWEPACGDGALVRPMRAAGFEVVATDLFDRGCEWSSGLDFMCRSYVQSLGPALVTNPPYSMANGAGGAVWVAKCVELMATGGLDYCALLLNSDWERSGKVRALLRRAPYSYQLQLGWRIDWTGDGRPKNWHSWFIWNRRSTARMAVRFLDRPAWLKNAKRSAE